MTTRTKTETAEVPAFTKDQVLTFDRYRGRRDLLGVLLENERCYTYDEVDTLVKDFMKGKVS